MIDGKDVLTSSRQQELYQQVILEHNKKPRNYYKPALFTHQAEGYNPLCGDHIWIYLFVDDENLVKEISFQGDGCAICKSSASIMTTALKGKKIDEVKEMIHDFHQMVKGEGDTAALGQKLGKLSVFTGVWQFPARIKCASLAWHTVRGALDNTPQMTSE